MPAVAPAGYFDSYRIATAPESYSSRLTSLRSTYLDSPANSVGPWPASRMGSCDEHGVAGNVIVDGRSRGK